MKKLTVKEKLANLLGRNKAEHETNLGYLMDIVKLYQGVYGFHEFNWMIFTYLKNFAEGKEWEEMCTQLGNYTDEWLTAIAGLYEEIYSNKEA